MNWEHILEAFVAFPSLLLETIVEGIHKIIVEEKQLILEGEYDQDIIEFDREHGIS